MAARPLAPAPRPARHPHGRRLRRSHPLPPPP
uniref:Uncharacterized protein n=1 Tax=Arundo donax TaxID=35708 RepID=A0A0A9BU85_ARUDO